MVAWTVLNSQPSVSTDEDLICCWLFTPDIVIIGVPIVRIIAKIPVMRTEPSCQG